MQKYIATSTLSDKFYNPVTFEAQNSKAKVFAIKIGYFFELLGVDDDATKLHSQ